MGGIVQANKCPGCHGVIFSFDYDKAQGCYVCKTCGCRFTPEVVSDDRSLQPMDRIGGYMNLSAVELCANTLQGNKQ